MRLRYIGLGVTDVEAEASFLREVFGLGEHRMPPGYVSFSADSSPEPYVVRLRPAPRNRVDLVAFAASAEGVDELRARAEGAGAAILDVPTIDGSTVDGFALFDPDGHLLQITEEQPASAVLSNIETGQGRPVDISHVVFNTTDNQTVAEWYCEVLGFRITDWLEDKMVFLTTDDSHHQIALAAAPNVGMNHIAFECADVDEFMRAVGRAMRQGNELLWGPGRHGPGDNTFAYFRDPAGFILEFTTGLESVAALDWEVRVWESVPEQSDVWGTANKRPAEVFLTPLDPELGSVPGRPGER